jgi:putative tricarboxylic transport membrane protein
MLISGGDLAAFVARPISTFFILLCVTLIAAQIHFRLRPGDKRVPSAATP